jgi:ribonuclease P protein component
VANAVGRNRLKRRVREIFRRHRPRMGLGWDVVVNLKPGALTMHSRQLERDFLGALKRTPVCRR